MSDLATALTDAAKALQIPDGDMLAMAVTARELEQRRHSNCQVYLTWAIIAEATQEALDNDLILVFRDG